MLINMSKFNNSFGVALIVIIAGTILKINLTEWLLCLLLMGIVMATELINTSLGSY